MGARFACQSAGENSKLLALFDEAWCAGASVTVTTYEPKPEAVDSFNPIEWAD